MKRNLLLLLLVIITQYVCGQSVALKTNGLYSLTTTRGWGVEVALSGKNDFGCLGGI